MDAQTSSGKSPIVTCLSGGMGNQMFQYAFGKAQALKFKAPLILNTAKFSPKDHCGRRYSLGLWQGCDYPIDNSKRLRIVREQGLPYNEKLLKLIRPGCILVGYWQCEKYFKHLAQELRRDFTPKQTLTSQGQETRAKIVEAGDRSVFVTIRRTDYLTSNFHNVLGIDYYTAALNRLMSVQPNPELFVFSDDPEWCKENLRLHNNQTIAGNFDRTTWDHLGREDEELHLMSLCKHAICANSSYSWWGAWLNPNPGMRIAPKMWFMSDKEDPKDIVPESWIRL